MLIRRKLVLLPIQLDYVESHRLMLREWECLHLILVGCGGTGSWLAPHLVRVAKTLRERNRKVEVVFIDPDHIELANLGRQNFCAAEIDHNKAKTLARRYGLAWGVPINALDRPFSSKCLPSGYWRDLVIIIGCVDNAAARSGIHQILENNTRDLPGIWWLDCGNLNDAGQILLGSSIHQPQDDEMFPPELIKVCARIPSPSVQHPELLEPLPEESSSHNLSCEDLMIANAQSLMINQKVAAEAADYLLRLTITGDLRRFATYLDLPSGSATSRYITPTEIGKVNWPFFLDEERY